MPDGRLRDANGTITLDVPSMVGLRTTRLAPLLRAWRRQNPSAPWAALLTRALKRELKPYATKRTAHLIKEVVA